MTADPVGMGPKLTWTKEGGQTFNKGLQGAPAALYFLCPGSDSRRRRALRPTVPDLKRNFGEQLASDRFPQPVRFSQAVQKYLI